MDLSTHYMGLRFSNPVVPSASPLSQDLGNVRRMEDEGAPAVVLWSLFEEQIEHEARELEYFWQYGAERFSESLTYYPELDDYKLGPEEYLEHIAKLREAVSIPIIASLNGVSAGGWTSYAQKIEQAGADALELNVYFIPTDTKVGCRQAEDVYLEILTEVKSVVSLPVALKLSPYFSSTANVMARLDQAGVDGLVLFNRFYQPDIDVEHLEVTPRLILSTSAEILLPLRWMAILHGRLKTSLAAGTGIHTAEDVAKMILAGADVTMMCSALLKNGIGHLSKVREGLTEIMERKGYESVSEMKGVLSQLSCPEPAAFERANYMKALHSFRPTGTLE